MIVKLNTGQIRTAVLAFACENCGGGGGGGSVSFGTDGQLPYMNSAGDDFDYTPSLRFFSSFRKLQIGDNLVIGNPSAGNGYVIIIGENMIISADHSWSAIFGDLHNITTAINNVLLAGGSITISGGAIAGGTISGISHTISGSGLKSGVTISGRSNTLNVDTDGRDNTLNGSSNEISGTSVTNAIAEGRNSLVTGSFARAWGYLISGTQRILAAGVHALNFSANTSSQTTGHGALADESVILGGRDHNIPSDSPRSAIIGGSAIKARATDPDQTYVPNLIFPVVPVTTSVRIRFIVTEHLKS